MKAISKLFTTIKNLDYSVAFKIGVSAGLSYYAGQWLSLVSGRPDFLNNLWCVLTSIVVIKPNLGGTYEASFYRFLGILIGSILGGFFSIYLGFNGLALSMGIFFTGIACMLLNIKDSIRIASLSVAVIMILHNLYPEHNPWVFSFFRFLDSVLGIVIAVFVSHFLFPKMAAQDLYLNLAKVLGLQGKLFRLSLEEGEHSDMHKLAVNQHCADIDKLLVDTRNLLSHSKLEIFSKEEGAEEYSMVLGSIERIYEAILSIRSAYQYKVTKIFDNALSDEIDKFRDQTSVAIEALIKQLENQMHAELPYPFVDEANAINSLNEELLRFRNTRSTRRFDLEDVENFYVFFYSMKQVGEELQRIEMHLTA